jgi:hypothetical protein
MSWSQRRQVSIFLGIVAVISIPLIIIALILFLRVEPTCFDGLQNGEETGLDCGGACALVCENEAIDPIVLWSRFFPAGQGYYNVVAYLENRNPTSGAKKVPYNFTFFENDVELENRSGYIDIPPKSFVPILANSLFTGERIPTRLAFDLGDHVWKKEELQKPPFFITGERVIQEGNNPRVAAKITNVTPRDIGEITAIVFVYGEFNNLMAFSSTYIEGLDAQEEKDMIFTWNQPFPEPVSKIEVIPQYK